jgi:hypothetical protein
MCILSGEALALPSLTWSVANLGPFFLSAASLWKRSWETWHRRIAGTGWKLGPVLNSAAPFATRARLHIHGPRREHENIGWGELGYDRSAWAWLVKNGLLWHSSASSHECQALDEVSRTVPRETWLSGIAKKRHRSLGTSTPSLSYAYPRIEYSERARSGWKKQGISWHADWYLAHITWGLEANIMRQV